MYGSKKYVYHGAPNNFWVPGNYQQVLKRLKLGSTMITNLMTYMKERVDAEDPSDRLINRWLQKWATGISKNRSDQGKVAQIIKIINDAHLQRVEINSRMKAVVMENILPKLQLLKQYSRNQGLRSIEKDFKRAQKPWAKSLKKVDKIKMVYHDACRVTLETSNYLESNRMPSGHGTSELTPEQREKIRTRHDEYAVEVERCRTMYEAALYELNFMKHEYQENMKEIFEQCVAIERERMQCFQECLELFAKAIDSGRNTQYTKVWATVDMTLLNYSVEQDLDYFSTTVGPGMPYRWPAFEEWENRPSQSYDD